MKIVALIQARLESTRLPRKVLMEIEGRSMLNRVCDRAERIPGVDTVCVVAPISDLPVFVEACTRSVYGYAGDPSDVLGRYDWAAKETGADVIIRLTGDDPLLDPALARDVLCAWLAGGGNVLADNVAPNTDGFDVEIFGARLLRYAHLEATDPYDREHVTPWMQRMAVRLRVPVEGECEKLSVDTAEDLERVRFVYRTIGKDFFSRQEAIEALRGMSA